MKLKLKDIRIDRGTQTRVGINEETVADYAEAMTEGAKFPAVVVFMDGSEYYLADGFHRVLAATRNGWREIDADVRAGTREDAIEHSLGANTVHGLRRTNADKRRCVEIALKEFAGMSDRAIAEMCGVSNNFVSEIRKEQMSSDDNSTRTGKDGKTYPASRTVKDVFKEAEQETKEKEDKGDEVSLRKAGPPRDGMGFARLAIMDLERIERNDAERKQAFETVKGWIKENEN